MAHHLLLPTLLLLSGPLIAQRTAADILRATRDRMIEHTSVSFTAEVVSRSANDTDTLRFTEQVWSWRDPTDTLYSGRILFTQGPDAFTLYDGRSILTCDRTTDSCMRHDPKKHQTGPMEYKQALLRWYAFLEPATQTARITDGTVLGMGRDSVIDGRTCDQVTFAFQANGQATGTMRNQWVDRSTAVPVMMHQRWMVEGNLQWYTVRYRDVRFDEVDSTFFRAERQLPMATITDHVDREFPRLALGTEIPPIRGIRYPQDSVASTIDWKGQVSFVDFWGLNCAPCRWSMPVVDSLHQVFGPRGVRFLGMNAWDHSPERLPILKKFLRERNIGSPLLLIDKEVESTFMVSAYPSFFIVDQEGRLTRVDLGFGTALVTDWAAELERLLAKGR